MRTRGFTLLELLIAVVVLGILAAILFPCGCPPRSVARSAACKSQLKQLAAAAAMYATDYDNHYPPPGITCLDPTQPDGSPGCAGGALQRTAHDVEDRSPASRYGYGETWQGGGLRVLDPYLKNERVLWCPEQEKVAATLTDPKSYYNGFEWLKSSNRVRYPASKVLLIETYSFHERDKQTQRLDDPPNPKRRYNLAFVDGHVKSVDLSTGCSGNPDPSCAGWESCMGPGGNGAYFCSGFGSGVDVPDFPVKNTGLMLECLTLPPGR